MGMNHLVLNTECTWS